MCSKREPFHALFPLLRHVVPHIDGDCGLTIRVVKGHSAREALLHAFTIGLFKYGKSNSTTMKHIDNESEDVNESCAVAFGVECMLTRTGLRYTLDAGHM